MLSQLDCLLPHVVVLCGSKEYYEALIARQTLLTAMTEEDLKVPVQGAAAAAVPSLLVAGLTAIVAFASA